MFVAKNSDKFICPTKNRFLYIVQPELKNELSSKTEQKMQVSSLILSSFYNCFSVILCKPF